MTGPIVGSRSAKLCRVCSIMGGCCNASSQHMNYHVN